MSLLRALVHSARHNSIVHSYVPASQRFASSYNSNLAGLSDEQLEVCHLLSVAGT